MKLQLYRYFSLENEGLVILKHYVRFLAAKLVNCPLPISVSTYNLWLEGKWCRCGGEEKSHTNLDAVMVLGCLLTICHTSIGAYPRPLYSI